MSNRIKGITVEIGGDATGLDKALKNVNSTIKNTQSQLKDVERLLKLDPSNTELLTQKQRLLKDAVSNTKDKLDALKTAQEQAKRQLENGDLGQDKYDALQREIIETEQQLEKLEEQAKRSSVALNKISEAGKGVKEVGGKISKVGSALTKGVTAPIMAVGAASMAAFTEVDSAIDSMITKTGAAGEKLEEMEAAVTGIATRIPTDFQTAADAVGEVSTRFDDVEDSLEDLSEYYVKFAAVNNIDVVSAIDNTQASMAAFGLTTDDAVAALDVLTKASQETGTDVNSLSVLMAQNAGVMKEMGFTYQDTAFFMANLNKNGVDVSSTMTGLKKAWQTASKDGKSMDTMLKEMNVTILSATTDQEAYQAAIDLFGAKAGPAIAEAVRSGRLSFEEFGLYLDDFEGMLADTYESTLDPIDQTTIAMNELKATGADLAGTMQELLLPILKTLNEKLKQFREWWTGLDDSQKQTIVKIAAIVAAVGPLLSILGKIVTVVGTIMTMAPALGGVIAALSGPIGIVIAIITALVAVGVLLYKNWDTIKEKAADMVNNIKEKWNNFKTFMSGFFQWLKDEADKKLDSIKDSFKNKFESIKEGVKSAIEKIKSFFKFEWSLPKIKLPHFSITGKFSLDPPSIPHISVEWYKKAMANGMILNSPTIFGMKDGNLLGAGEAGSETVVGTNALMKMVQSAVNNARGSVTYGDLNVYCISNGADVEAISEDLAAAVSNKLRISGVWAPAKY